MARAPRQTGSTSVIGTSAMRFLARHPDGIGFSDLVRLITEENPALNINTVKTTTAALESNYGEKVYKPAHGIYRLVEFRDASTGELKEELAPIASQNSLKESDFYQSFADWLVNETEECTKAVAVGGSRLGGKWGTPDVMGVRSPKSSDILKVPSEIVCAEIKIDTTQLITAFGQACAYSLFSHKTYLVIPKNSPQDDISRLDRLCQGYGIGLVLFDAERKPTDKQDTEYTIRVRPQRHEPDMFYSNKIAKTLEGMGVLF